MLLQDSDPLLLPVIGHRGPAVPAGAVVVHHPPALPLQRGGARLAARAGGLEPREDEHRRAGSGHEQQQESEHRYFHSESRYTPLLLLLLLTGSCKATSLKKKQRFRFEYVRTFRIKVQ